MPDGDNKNWHDCVPDGTITDVDERPIRYVYEGSYVSDGIIYYLDDGTASWKADGMD